MASWPGQGEMLDRGRVKHIRAQMHTVIRAVYTNFGIATTNYGFSEVGPFAPTVNFDR